MDAAGSAGGGVVRGIGVIRTTRKSRGTRWHRAACRTGHFETRSTNKCVAPYGRPVSLGKRFHDDAMVTTAVFLDTNIHLHYQPVEAIDWCTELKVPRVDVIVPPVVIRELNKHKDSSQDRRLKQRATTVLRSLFSRFEGSASSTPRATVRPDVDVVFEPSDARIDFEAHRLSPLIQDDHLLASVLQFRQDHPEAPIILVAADYGLIMKACAHNIDARLLSDRWKKPEDVDHLEARNKELEAEVRRLSEKIPHLKLTFHDGASFVRVSLPKPFQPAPENIITELDHIKRKYPKMIDPTSQPSSVIDFNQISPEQIAQYNQKLDQFYADYDRYLHAKGGWGNHMRRTVALQMLLVNDGSVPAQDIDIILHFPDGFALYNAATLPGPPREPKPPGKPRSPLDSLHAASLSRVLDPVGRLPEFWQMPVVPPHHNVSEPEIRRTNSYEVTIQVERVKHGLPEALDPLFVAFDSFDGAASFQITYTLHAENLPSKATGELHVKVEHELPEDQGANG